MFYKKLESGKYRFFEKFFDEHLKKWRQVTVTMNSKSRVSQSEARDRLSQKIDLIQSTADFAEEKTNLTIPYPIKYGRTNGSSIWVEKEIVDLLMLWEFITKKGSWLSATEEFDELLVENGFPRFEKIQGQEALFNFIEADKNLSNFLIN